MSKSSNKYFCIFYSLDLLLLSANFLAYAEQANNGSSQTCNDHQ